MTMTAQGKAFEFALARQLNTVTGAPLVSDSNMETARLHYEGFGTEDMDDAAAEAVLFLHAYDSQFSDAESIRLLPDARGQGGDVRDVVVQLFDSEVGLSAKHNHTGIKHPRISEEGDWGEKWTGHPVGIEYRQRVRPIFRRLARLRDQDAYFRDIPDKEESVYLPVLAAFEDEFMRLCQEYGRPFIQRVFQYMVGQHDYYKVVKQPGHVSVQSYNINGTLEWGQRWNIPEGIEGIRRRPNSLNTLLVSFSGGWQVSFRLHNAEARVIPSLKFDMQFVAMPVNVATHQIPLSN